MPPVVFFDFASTLNTQESFDTVIHHVFKKHPDNSDMIRDIEHITALGMEGKIPFTESLERRFAALPLTKQDFIEVGMELTHHTTPGMPEILVWLQSEQVPVYVVSGGFWECITPSTEALSIPETSVYTNRMLFDETGRATAIDHSTLLYTDHGKAPVIQEVMSTHPNTTAILVGDGMNDYRAYAEGAVRTFIGFGANVERAIVKEHAPFFAHTSSELRGILNIHLHPRTT